MADSLTSKECCKHEEQALAWETVFGQLRKGNEKFYLGDGTGEQLAVREIERLQRENTALRNLAENLRPGPISVALGGAEHEAPYRAAVLSQSFTPSNDPPTHQELFSAVNHFAREILRLTDAAPVACTAEPPTVALPPTTQSKPDAQIADELQVNMDALIEPEGEDLAKYRRLIRIMARARSRLQQIADAQRPAETKTEHPAVEQSAANSEQCVSRKAAQSGTAAGSSDETSVCGGCGIPLPLKPGTAHWSGCKHSESEDASRE